MVQTEEKRGNGRGHCGAAAAVGTGVLRLFVGMQRTGEPVSGPRAVEAGKAEIPEEEYGEKSAVSHVVAGDHHQDRVT